MEPFWRSSSSSMRRGQGRELPEDRSVRQASRRTRRASSSRSRSAASPATGSSATSRSAVQATGRSVPEGESTQRLVKLSRELRHDDRRRPDRDRERSHVTTRTSSRCRTAERRRHRKIQAFEHDAHLARRRSTPSSTRRTACRVGVLICYDNNIIENVRITALMGAEVLLAPHQTGGCNSASPHGMKPIDPAIWHDRAADPDAIRRGNAGRQGQGVAHALAPRRARTTTACSCSSPTASASTTTRSARATR